jgi:protease-4
MQYQYSFIRDLVQSVWAVDAMTAQIYAPVLRGVFNGLHFEREYPDTKYLPYQVSTITYQPSAHEGDNMVFVQPMRGVLMKHSTESGVIGTRRMAENLLKADKNSTIIGHILLIESGGGQVAAVPELTDAIQKLTKPIVAFVDGTMCSAAMYIGSYCKKIIASRETDYIDVSVQWYNCKDFQSSTENPMDLLPQEFMPTVLKKKMPIMKKLLTAISN